MKARHGAWPAVAPVDVAPWVLALLVAGLGLFAASPLTAPAAPRGGELGTIVVHTSPGPDDRPSQGRSVGPSSGPPTTSCRRVSRRPASATRRSPRSSRETPTVPVRRRRPRRSTPSFLVEVLGETLAHRVTDTRAVDPRDLTALRLEDDRDLVTLVTCTPRGENTHRLLVTGECAEHVATSTPGTECRWIRGRAALTALLAERAPHPEPVVYLIDDALVAAGDPLWDALLTWTDAHPQTRVVISSADIPDIARDDAAVVVLDERHLRFDDEELGQQARRVHARGGAGPGGGARPPVAALGPEPAQRR